MQRRGRPAVEPTPMRGDSNVCVDAATPRRAAVREDPGQGHDPAAGWLVCRCGAQHLALPLSQVIETLRPLPTIPVTAAPPYVSGVCIIRGAPVPVLDAGLLLFGQEFPSTRLVTLATGPRTTALAVEAVVRICRLDSDALCRLPPLLHDAAQGTIAEIAMLDSELLYCLQTAHLIPDDAHDLLQAGKWQP